MPSQARPVDLAKESCGPGHGRDWFSSSGLLERSDGLLFLSLVHLWLETWLLVESYLKSPPAPPATPPQVWWRFHSKFFPGTVPHFPSLGEGSCWESSPAEAS